MRHFLYVSLLMFIAGNCLGQMEINGQIKYGNEWIDQNNKHIELKVMQEGMYKVSYQELVNNGFSAAQLNGNDLQMFSHGRQVPLYTTSEGTWSSSDYLLFHGEGQKGEIDAYLFEDAADAQLNPEYSMYSDARSYFLRLRPNANFSARYDEEPNDLSGNLPIPSSHYMEREKQVFYSNIINPGTPVSQDVHYSHFIRMEGFSSRMDRETDVDIPVDNLYKGADAGQPSLNMRTGSNNVNHYVEITLNNSPLISDNYNGPLVRQYNETFPLNFLKDDNTNRVKIKGFSSADNLSVSFAELIYPRTYDAGTQRTKIFYSPSSNFSEYIEFKNIQGNDLWMFDVENNYFLRADIDGSTAKFLMPAKAIKQAKCILLNEDQFATPVSIEAVELTKFDPMAPEFLILTHKDLHDPAAGLTAVQEYADFRSSALGGNYKVGIITMDEIYDQFSYGIDEHCIATRNFSQYIKDKWPDFEMVLIIGKGLSFPNKNKSTSAKNLVPTFGRPGSDNLLFADPDNTYPYVAVGRVAARSQEDVRNYLDKATINARLSDVSSLSIEDRLWLKRVLHLSGGSADIQEEIYAKLNFMASKIEQNNYAADVKTVRKNSTDPVTTELTADILKSINDGISLMTFFGHSSAGTFDFSVEDPSSYENYGRHPVVLSMGCHSGDIHENTFSLSEEFILTQDLGAIAFIASSGNAFPNPLATLGNSLYDKIGEDYYGQPLGLAVREALEEGHNRIYEDYLDSPMAKPFYDLFVEYITLHQQNTFHGDPAIRLYFSEGPDYVVDLQTFRTLDVVGTTDDFVELEFDILNLGSNRGSNVTLNNYVIHEYGGKVDTVYFTSPAPSNSTKVNVQIPNPGKAALGENKINVVLDVDQQVAEMPLPIAETNNDMKIAWSSTDGYVYFVFDNSARTIYPQEFGIVGSSDFELIASSSNAFADKSWFQLELDTTETFDSPFLKTTEVLTSPAAIKWNPGITYEQETVYYWRVKAKDDVNAIWSISSFVYLQGEKPGWNQSHYYQWDKDIYTNSLRDSNSRKWVYTDNINEIRIKNGSAALDGYVPEIIYQNNPTQYLPYGGDLTSGVYLATFDGETGVARTNDVSDFGEFGSFVYSQWVEDFICYPYWTRTKDERASVINFIESEVPDGDYVALLTIQRSDIGRPDYKPELWAADGSGGDPDLMSTLEKYGAQQVRGLAAKAVPYILVFKKNDPSFTPLEIVASDVDQQIETAFTIVAKWFEGEMRSTTIGPATEWDKLLWNIDEIDLQEDNYRLDIVGCDADGEETILFENVDEFDFDLSSVNATQYPILKLNLFSSDEVSRTPPQMEYWRILYKGLPEAILDTEAKFVYDADSLFLGDVFKFQSIATNVTDIDMDSLLVEYTIVDKNNKSQLFQERLAPLKGNESLDLDFEISTTEFLGLNEFKVEINPSEEQREQHYFNNLGLRSFHVDGDNINPVIDVTFDGVRIMNGDLVAPAPIITVLLKDENAFLPVTDVSSFDLAIQALPSDQPTPIELDGDNVTFVPADSTNGFCARLEIMREPAFETGDYILYVQGKDASGNLSGDQSYQVEFTVFSESGVTKVLNYPNPFSTSTEFVFTLTGTQVPDVFTIQIFTLSGKVVKEITKEELGPLRIGENRTDYKWNGTDDFGNRLANGVYLYRVITSEVDGEALKEINQNYVEDRLDAIKDGEPDRVVVKRKDNIDGFFKKGFGKLVIMR